MKRTHEVDCLRLEIFEVCRTRNEADGILLTSHSTSLALSHGTSGFFFWVFSRLASCGSVIRVSTAPSKITVVLEPRPTYHQHTRRVKEEERDSATTGLRSVIAKKTGPRAAVRTDADRKNGQSHAMGPGSGKALWGEAGEDVSRAMDHLATQPKETCSIWLSWKWAYIACSDKMATLLTH